MNRNALVIVFIIFILALIYLFLSALPEREDISLLSSDSNDNATAFYSDALGFGFSYPSDYFITEHEVGTGERLQYSIVLMPDTQENRDLVAGTLPPREAPPTITIGIFQNNLDGHTTEEWIQGTSFSNFKLSDEVLKVVTVGGTSGLRYNTTGLYENDNIVVALPSEVYMFTVSYLTEGDEIRDIFENIVRSVTFK